MSKDSPLPPSPNRPLTTPERVFDEPTLAEPDFMVGGNEFWDKYKLPIVALLTLVVVGLVASEVYASLRQKAAAKASERLDAAQNSTDFQKIIDKFPGTPGAANAYLLLGRERMDARDYAGAVKAWQSFADKYPQNALAPTALVGVGGALETTGKYEDARSAYQKAATSYPKSYVAPLARLDEASLLRAQRKLEEARRVYEDILASYPQSEMIPEVQAQLASLKSLPPVSGHPAAAVLPAPAAPAPAPDAAFNAARPSGIASPVNSAAVAQPSATPTTNVTAPAMSPGALVSPAVQPPSPAAVDAAAALGAPEPVLPRSSAPANTAMPTPPSSNPVPKP